MKSVNHPRRSFLQIPLSGTAPELTIKSVETFIVEGACFVKVTASNGVAGWGEADADNAPLMEFVDVDRFVFLRGLMKSNMQFEKGYLFVPPGVGLGVEVDEAAVKRAVVAG